MFPSCTLDLISTLNITDTNSSSLLLRRSRRREEEQEEEGRALGPGGALLHAAAL